MAQTNVQAFSGDVEIANTLTVSDDIIVDDGTNHSLTIDPTTSMIYNKQLSFINAAVNSYNYLGRFRVYAPPAIFNIWDTGSALGSGSRYSMSKGYGQPQPPIMNALEGSEFSTYRFYWEPEAAGGGSEVQFYHVWFSPSRQGNYTFYIHAKDYLFPTEPSSPTYNDVIYGMVNLLGSNGTQSHVVVGRPNMSGSATLQLHNESQTGDRLTHEAIQLFSNTTPDTGDFSNVFITMTPSITNGGYGGYIEGWIKSGTSSGLSLGNISQGTKYRGLTITSQGSVGIGTTNPVSVLNVVGNAAIENSEDTGFSNVIALSIQAKSSDHTSITNGYGSRIQFRTNRGTNQGGSAQSADIKGYVWSGAGSGQDYHALDLNVYGDNSSLNKGISILSNSSTGGPAKTIMHGKVGIGTTNPGAPFEVHGADLSGEPNGTTGILSRHVAGEDGVLNIFGLQAPNGEETVGLQTQIDGRAWQSDIDGGWSYGPDSRYDLSLQPYKGNVGIGTTDPVEKLHIYTTDSNHQAAPDGASPAAHILLRNSKGSGTPYSMAIGVDESLGIGYINNAGASATRPICLNTRGSTVGIGTTDPVAKLHVYGVAGDDNMLRLQSGRGEAPTLSFSWSGGNAENFEMTDVDGGQRGFLFGRRYTTGTNQNTNAGWHMYGSTGALGVRINYDGLVGISQSTPLYTLDVTGTIRCGTNGRMLNSYVSVPYGSWANIPLGASRGSYLILAAGTSNDQACAIFTACANSNNNSGSISTQQSNNDYNRNSYIDRRYAANLGPQLIISGSQGFTRTCSVTTIQV